MIYCIMQIYENIGEQKIIHLLLLILSNINMDVQSQPASATLRNKFVKALLWC